VVHVQITGVPRRQDGNVAGAFTIVTDVTAQKQAEEAYRTLVENSLQGLLIIQDFRVVFANKQVERISGYTVAELLAWSPEAFMDQVHEEDRVAVAERLRAHLAGEPVPARMVFRIYHKDGRTRWVEVHTSHITYQGQAAAQVAYLDVTEREEADEALRQSEEKHRRLLNSIRSPVLALSPEMTILYCNRAYSEFVGQPVDELEGQNLLALFPEFRQTRSYAACLDALTSGEPQAVEGRMRHWYWQARVYPTPWGILAIADDMTERKEAEARLLQEKQLSEAIIDSLPGTFYIFDDTGRLVRWNKRMETIPGYTAAEVARMGPLDFIAPDDRAAVASALQAVFTEGQASVEAKLLFKDGRQRPYLLTGHRFLIDDRPHLIGVGLDISDRVEVEEALRASEERYRSLVHNVGDIIFQLDAAGRWTFLNNAWTEITGFSVAESLGQEVLQYVHPDDRERNKTELQSLLAREKEFCDHQSRYVTQSGSHRWLEVHARRIEDAAGEIKGVSGLLRDVTERKQHEQELECMVAVTQALRQANTREQMLPVILDQAMALLQAGGAMFVTHSRQDNKQVELARGAWQAVSGQALPPELSLADFTADSGKLYIIADVGQSLPQQYAALLDPHYALMGVPVLSNSQVDGVLWVGRSQSFSAVEGRSLQAIAGIMATALSRARLLDTLEQQVIERTQALALANERLQELDRLKTKFIDDVSHELRTPAANITLYLDLLARSHQERWESYLNALRHNSSRLNEIMDSILQFTRLAKMHAVDTATTLNLNQVTAVVVRDYHSQAEAAAVDLVWTPADDLPPVWGMAGLVAQAIAYLLDNAIKYTAVGPAGGRVDISALLDQGQQMAGVQVKDTGIGIEQDELNHVFDRFYRGRRVGQLSTPGAGLGLSLAQQIAAQHGGSIEIDSQVDVGTAVTLWLPLAQEGTP
jgi:PAS domain S-box-containing protein